MRFHLPAKLGAGTKRFGLGWRVPFQKFYGEVFFGRNVLDWAFHFRSFTVRLSCFRDCFHPVPCSREPPDANGLGTPTNHMNAKEGCFKHFSATSPEAVKHHLIMKI
jgi:hypothetical protein